MLTFLYYAIKINFLLKKIFFLSKTNQHLDYNKICVFYFEKNVNVFVQLITKTIVDYQQVKEMIVKIKLKIKLKPFAHLQMEHISESVLNITIQRVWLLQKV